MIAEIDNMIIDYFKEHPDSQAIRWVFLENNNTYMYKLGVVHARCAIGLWRHGNGSERKWVHVGERLNFRGGNYAKARYWGLIEQSSEVAEDGNNSGDWRLTPLGQQWVLEEITLPQRVQLGAKGTLLTEPFGAPVDIRGALGTKFDYRELMAG